MPIWRWAVLAAAGVLVSTRGTWAAGAGTVQIPVMGPDARVLVNTPVDIRAGGGYYSGPGPMAALEAHVITDEKGVATFGWPEGRAVFWVTTVGSAQRMARRGSRRWTLGGR